MRQTNARRVSFLNKSANGNHLGQNDPHPAVDDKDPCSEFSWGSAEDRDLSGARDVARPDTVRLRPNPGQRKR